MHKAQLLIESELKLLYACLKNPKIKLSASNNTRYQWTGTGSELLELALGIHSSDRLKALNGEEIKFSTFIADFQRFFNYKIADIKGRKSKLMMRKKEQTPFLKELKQSLTTLFAQHFD